MQDKKQNLNLNQNVHKLGLDKIYGHYVVPGNPEKLLPLWAFLDPGLVATSLIGFFFFYTQVLTAVLFLPATTYQTAVVMDCVWITMFANATKDGLGITVHNSLVSTWIIVQVTRLLLYIMNENFSLELQFNS